MNIVKNSNKISTLINLQNNTDVISRQQAWVGLRRAGACISHQQCVSCRAFLLHVLHMNMVKINNKISTLINLQNNADVISRRQYTCTPCRSCVRTQVHMFIYRSNRYKFHGHLIPSHIKRVVSEWL